MVNTFLMDQVMGHIEAHPETHSQRHFGVKNACGTTLCFAGHTVTVAGGKINWDRAYGPLEGETIAKWVTMPDGKDYPIESKAAELLGLVPTESDALFYYIPLPHDGNEVELVKTRVKEIQNGEYR